MGEICEFSKYAGGLPKSDWVKKRRVTAREGFLQEGVSKCYSRE
jgi:hypothetical protein